MGAAYVELHAKSFYSFGLGASHIHELLTQAKAHGCHALSLTDTNLCGALEFARLANSLDIQPITGGELVLQDGSRLTLLARTREGYANLSRLFTLASDVDRRQPKLDPAHLPEHTEGVTLLCGGRGGRLSSLLQDGRRQEAERLLRDYLSWYGSGSVYVELQQNFLSGDTARNRELSRLGREQNVPLIASNDAHYHVPTRYRLQNALVAARHNITIDQALPLISPNPHLCLKSPAQMAELFSDCPEALANAVRVAESCTFNLSTDLGYALPEPDVPMGYTPQRYLKQLCIEAAIRRYGAITPQIEARLEEEMRLVQRHHLAGFLLLYREIVLIAQQVMQERGLAPPETPLEERAPGRGRGSSVSLLVGYLIGISHVDPIKWNLTLERFISEDMTSLPDIDLDFPRGLRETLIERVHNHFGPHFAVLTGAIHTYTVKGIVQDLGKALGLPPQALSQLSKQLNSRDAADLRREMLALDAFRDRVDAPGWRHLLQLAPQLMGAPKLLSQHVGGMVLSSSPIPEMVPVRAGATQGRFIMDWDKDSVADANFAKIDLAFPASPPGAGPAGRGRGPDRGEGGTAPGPQPHRPGRSQGLRPHQRGPGQGRLPAAIAGPAQDGPAPQVAQPAGPRLPGRPDPSRCRHARQRGVQLRRPLPPRRRVGLRPPPGEARPGARLRHHRVAGAGGATGHGRSGHERRRGRRNPPRLRQAEQPAPHRRAPQAFSGAGAAARRAPGNRREDFRQDQRSLHVPRVAQLRLWHHGLPGGLDEVPLPARVFRRPDQQPAHGLLPAGNAQAGRAALRRGLPQPVREPQPGGLRARGGRPAAGPAVREGCGQGRRGADRGRAPPGRQLRQPRRPGAAHRRQGAGSAVPGARRGIRRPQSQPPRGPVGGRAGGASVAPGAGGAGPADRGPGGRAGGTSRTTRRWPASTASWACTRAAT